ncbi:hypothetical protein AMELA_G00259830, partial [Ameiurus melas]
GYRRNGPTAGTHDKKVTPSPTATQARSGQPRARHNTSWKDRHGGAEPPTQYRPAIGESVGRIPPLRRWGKSIRERSSAHARKSTNSQTTCASFCCIKVFRPQTRQYNSSNLSLSLSFSLILFLKVWVWTKTTAGKISQEGG